MGHESDLLVSDLVADLRASTPSNAIELCVPEYDHHYMLNQQLWIRLDEATVRLFTDWRNNLQLFRSRLLNAPLKGILNANQQVSNLGNRLSIAVSTKFSDARKQLQIIASAMQLAMQKSIADETTRLAVIKSALNSAHPRNVLDRGYSMITSKSGTILTKTEDLVKGQQIILALNDGNAKATIDEINKK